MLRPTPNPKLLRVSERWYRRLLVLYPRRHRAEFGAAMTQLFRDQGGDAWREARLCGLLVLWLRILPDLLKSSFIEHLANLKGKKFMSKNIFANSRASSAPWLAFLIVFVLTFGLVLFTTTIVTLILPEAYSSRAVVRLDALAASNAIYDPYLIQTEHEIVQSGMILDRVIDRLDLNEIWQKKYGAESKFKTPESRALLKRMIEVRPVRNTMLMDITVFSGDKQEAANIANAIATTYADYHKQQWMLSEKYGPKIPNATRVELRVERIESATPGLRPVRPNKPLNIFLGAVIGVALGILTGSIAGFLVFFFQRRDNSPPPIPQPTGAA